MGTKVTLSDNVPITKDDNTPTTYFVRQLELLLAETVDNAVAVIAAQDAAVAAQTTADAAVPSARHINTTAPLAGGGDLTADRTLTFTPAAAQADSVATTIAGIVADFNSLLATLRSGGILHP